MKTHIIEYYWPDGQKGPDEQAPILHNTRWESEGAARKVLIDLCGESAVWTDDEGFPCYHESEEIGCGGYCIKPINEERISDLAGRAFDELVSKGVPPAKAASALLRVMFGG